MRRTVVLPLPRSGRRALAVAAAALALGAAGVWVVQPQLTREELLARARPVPTPYAVPTTAATDALPEVGSTRLRAVGRLEHSVPWSLIRLWDDGRRLAVQHPATCDARATVRVEESDRAVVVQVVAARSDSGAGGGCSSGARTLVTLDRPLGQRQLLQAGTSARSPESSERIRLSDVFDDAPVWPGEPWFQGGREVTHDELSTAAGPEHCDWQDAVHLSGTALSAPGDERGRLWSRDPRGVLTHFPRARTDFREGAVLPDDARATGYSQGAVELWTAPSDRHEYVYLVNSRDRTDVERWVRGGGGCA